MNKEKIVIGTRGSKLALYQAQRVKSELEKHYPDITAELKIIKTKGDKILDVALSKIGDKGLFTKEIEVALLNGDIDIAVHSLKDLPTHLPEGMALGGVLKRGEVRDALVSKSGKKLSELNSKDVIATSSLRRSSALLRYNSSLNIIDIRGNVNRRLEKMENGYCDAMIMAATGLERLGLDKYITEYLDPNIIIPAVSQGAIALEIRENDNDIQEVIDEVNHTDTLNAVLAERAFLRTLQGGCQVPVGCYSEMNTDSITLTGIVSSLDGKNVVKSSINGDIHNTEKLGVQLARDLIKNGAETILTDIRDHLNSNA